MGKPTKKERDAAAAAEATEGKGQGKTVMLPNGEKRSDYIRDEYYGSGENKGNRGAIKRAVNAMLEKAGREDEQIPYQIVFAATKNADEDPRVGQATRKAERADAKAAKDAEKAEAKEKAAAVKKKAADDKAKADAKAAKK